MAAGRRRRTAAALLTLLLTAACGSASDASSARSSPAASTPVLRTVRQPAPAVAGISAEVVQLRTDVAVGGQVQVRVTDTGEAPFTVTSVVIDSPGFAPLPPKQVVARYEPRRVIDLPTPFGDPVCDVAAEPAAARLTVQRRPGGVSEQLRVPLSAATLATIHRQECAVLAVSAVASPSVTDLHDVPDGLAGTLSLTRRRGSDPVVAAGLGRSVVIQPTAEGLPLELAGNRATASTGVTFRPAACDPHVLADTKQPFVFPLHLRVGDGDDVAVTLPLDEAAKARLLAMLGRVCGTSG